MPKTGLTGDIYFLAALRSRVRINFSGNSFALNREVNI